MNLSSISKKKIKTGKISKTKNSMECAKNTGDSHCSQANSLSDTKMASVFTCDMELLSFFNIFFVNFTCES